MIYGLIILVAINTELEFTDRVSLDAIEQSMENSPTAFLWPLCFLFGALGLAILGSVSKVRFLKAPLFYAAIFLFVFGSIQLTDLMS